MKIDIDDSDIYELLKFKDKVEWRCLEYNDYDNLSRKIIKSILSSISIEDFIRANSSVG